MEKSDLDMKHYLRIILISFSLLFLELLLIRWIGTEIRIFAYLSNLILLAAFVGSGIGMLIKRHFSLTVSFFLLFLLVLLIITKALAGITDMLAPLSETSFWFQTAYGSIFGMIAGLMLTLLLFFLVLFIFIPLGQYLGRLFNQTSNIIRAYSFNIVASIGGMWAFYGLSWLSFPPFWGVILVEIIFLFLLVGQGQKRIGMVFLLATVVLGLGAMGKNSDLITNYVKESWSPYQKLTLTKLPERDLRPAGYLLQVNNVVYMKLLDLSKEYQEGLAEKLRAEDLPENFDLRFADQYQLPFVFQPKAKDVLIIGAGGGNDVAGAVRAGATHIDAVEIDPQIVEFGRTYHPEQPYRSERVRVIVDDGRSFFRKTEKRYDLVIMGLADSHTLTSSLTNLRLDHYLYTRESFEEIKRIMKPEGVLFTSFEVIKPWIGGRIQKNIQETFSQQPVIFELRDNPFFGLGGVMFVTDNNEGRQLQRLLEQSDDLRKFVSARTVELDAQEEKEEARPLTDNWPYLYLDQPRIPKIHLFLSIFLLAILFLFKRFAVSVSGFRFDFFFLGAGFLLYEFQNINKTALLYGNTWTTNLFVITAILILILLANLIYARWRVPLSWSGFGLVLTFGSQWLVPLSFFNTLPFLTKAIGSTLFLNLPLLFSALIFIALFARVENKSSAFASNLIGSAVGGMLEAFAFLWGINSLLAVSLLFYLIALILILVKEKRGAFQSSFS